MVPYNYYCCVSTKDQQYLLSSAVEFGFRPTHAILAKYFMVDEKILTKFLLSSTDYVYKFFLFNHNTLLVYVYFVDQSIKILPHRNGCVNDFTAGYSYVVALDASLVPSNLRLKEIIRVIEQDTDTDDYMFRGCKVLWNWAPSTIEQLRHRIQEFKSGKMLFNLKNVYGLETGYDELFERIAKIERHISFLSGKNDFTLKSWELAKNLALSYPRMVHDQLFECFQNFTGTYSFYLKVCAVFENNYYEEIRATANQQLYIDVCSLSYFVHPDDDLNTGQKQLTEFPEKTIFNHGTGINSSNFPPDTSNFVTKPWIMTQNSTMNRYCPDDLNNVQQQLPEPSGKQYFHRGTNNVNNSSDSPQTIPSASIENARNLSRETPPAEPKKILQYIPDLPQSKLLNRPMPKTVVYIPRDSSSFWLKVFDGQDVLIKEHDSSGVNATTKNGEKITVQLIQPVRFRRIAVVNEVDKTFKKGSQRFVCQFCATLVRVYSDDEGDVYCRCGRYKDSDFIPADHNFKSRKPKIPADEMNILLIGASGAGKSTLINNIANLVKFKTQKEAYNGELTAVIPSRFVVGKSRDTLDVETIVVGQDLPEAENEDFNNFGQSITQRPRTCSITAELPSGDTKKFNFIDTPGINDTRGLDQDDINIDHIKRAVIQAGYLHAICIVLLPNQSRMEADFESVLRRLLQFVPLEHRPNLVLFFTNTRGTLYRPGQTYPVLRKFAEAEPDLQIPLDQNRLFCFDSESYNFLCAHHHGIEYDLTSPSQYKDSWKESRKSLYRFFEFLDTVTPFATSEIQFIDTAHTLFIKCAKALKKLPNTNTQYDTAVHLIGVLASSFNGQVPRALEIAQAIGFTEDVKLLRCQQLAFFRQLTLIDGFLSDKLTRRILDLTEIYEPFSRVLLN